MRKANFHPEHIRGIRAEIINRKDPEIGPLIARILEITIGGNNVRLFARPVVEDLAAACGENRAVGDTLLWAVKSVSLTEGNFHFLQLSHLLREFKFRSSRPVVYGAIPGFVEFPLTTQVGREVHRHLIDAFHKLGATQIDLAPVELRETIETFAPSAHDLVGLQGRFFNQAVLRRDHTFGAVQRVVQDNARLAFPLLASQYAQCFRAEQLEKGPDGRHLRGFIQADLDVFDNRKVNFTEKRRQEMQILLSINDLLTDLINRIDLSADKNPGVPPIQFRISNRKLAAGMLSAHGIRPEQIQFTISALDKVEDCSSKEFPDKLTETLKELKISLRQRALKDSITLTPALAEGLWQLRRIKGTGGEVIDALRELAATLPDLESEGGRQFVVGVKELRALQLRLTPRADRISYMLDAGLTRTCPIYTGMEFEVSWPAHPSAGSIAAGGRYDQIAFDLTKTAMSGVGGAIGVTRILHTLARTGSLKRIALADLIVTTRSKAMDVPEEIAHDELMDVVCKELRGSGFSVRRLDPMDDPDKAFSEYARKNLIPWVYYADLCELLDVETATRRRCKLSDIKKVLS